MWILDYFSKPSQKESPKLVWVQSFQGISVSVDYSLDAYYRMYDQNAYVQMVIGKLMWYVTKDGFALKRYKKDQDGLLEQVCIGHTPIQFIQRIERDYEVTGNAYVYKATTESGVFVWFQILDPRYVKPLVSPKWEVLGYVQNLSGIRYFLPDEVYHLKWDTDIINETVGRSKMKTLLIELMTDEEASKSNLAFFKNNQTPSSIVLIDNEYDFGTEAEKAKALGELKAMFNSGKYNGWENHHRSAFAQGIKDILKVQDKISDMEFLELRKFTLDLVCWVYEVPKDILGYTDTSNRSVGDTQSWNFDDVIQSKKATLAEFITMMLKSTLGNEYSLEFKIDEQAMKIKNIKTAGEAWQSWVAKLNEAREIANLPPDDKEWNSYFKEKAVDVSPPQEQKKLKIIPKKK